MCECVWQFSDLAGLWLVGGEQGKGSWKVTEFVRKAGSLCKVCVAHEGDYLKNKIQMCSGLEYNYYTAKLYDHLINRCTKCDL